MRSLHLHPYRTPEEVHQVVDRLHAEVSPIVHPQQIIQKMRSEQPPVGRLNGWLADHIRTTAPGPTSANP